MIGLVLAPDQNRDSVAIGGEQRVEDRASDVPGAEQEDGGLRHPGPSAGNEREGVWAPHADCKCDLGLGLV